MHRWRKGHNRDDPVKGGNLHLTAALGAPFAALVEGVRHAVARATRSNIDQLAAKSTRRQGPVVVGRYFLSVLIKET